MPADRKQLNREKIESVIELLKNNTNINNSKLDNIENATEIGEALEVVNNK